MPHPNSQSVTFTALLVEQNGSTEQSMITLDAAAAVELGEELVRQGVALREAEERSRTEWYVGMEKRRRALRSVGT